MVPIIFFSGLLIASIAFVREHRRFPEPDGSDGEALSATACVAGHGVAEDEALAVETTLIVQDDAAQVDGALFVEVDLEIVIVENGVAVCVLGEIEQVHEAGAAAALDPKAQADVVPLIVVDEGADLLLRFRGEHHHLVAGGRLDR